MDNNSKVLAASVFAFILGAGTSGIATFFITKGYFKKRCDEEIQNQTEYYMRKYDILKENTDDSNVEEKGNDEESAKVQIKKEDISNLYKSSAPEEMDKTHYGSYFDGNNVDRNDISGNKPAKKSTGKKSGPKLVNIDIWNNNPDNYDKKFFTYYDADSVMIDEETEKVVDNGEALIGIENLEQADQFDDVIFVSNSKTKTVYQVTVEQMAFSEVGFND